MQGAARSQWLFHWQASQRSRRRPDAQPEGPEGLLARTNSKTASKCSKIDLDDRRSWAPKGLPAHSRGKSDRPLRDNAESSSIQGAYRASNFANQDARHGYHRSCRYCPSNGRPGKGIIAIDESSNTIKKRFDAVGIECTEETRRAYREMLLTTPNLGDHISGAILYDETLRQSTKTGKRFVDLMNAAGILPGIKVDLGPVGLAGFPGEQITQGLDGLRERLKEYVGLGAKFAKWRAVINIGEDMPSAAVSTRTAMRWRYAALARAGLVPIVEPES
jgi:hypothetical protein